MAVRSETGPLADRHRHHGAAGGRVESAHLAIALAVALERAALAARHLGVELETDGAGTDNEPKGAGAESAPVLASPFPDGPIPCPHALSDLRWASGRVAEVDRALAEARATFARLGATLARAHADRLAALAPTCDPVDLTEREVAALRLAAAGRSNREAAAALAVSERTIERHLENAYRKIGARNRADAVTYALRHRLS